MGGCILGEVVTAFRAQREQKTVSVCLIRILGNLGTVHATSEEIENRVFSAPCQRNLKNVTVAAHLGFVVRENSVREIAR